MKFRLPRTPTELMLLGGAAGLILPARFAPSASWIGLLLCVVNFISYFRVDPAHLNWKMAVSAAGFSLKRFVVLPPLLWLVARLWNSELAASVLLLSLAPGGVAGPTFTGLLNGNVALALSVTVISSLICVISIPVCAPLFDAPGASVNALSLLTSLLLLIGLPGIFYALLKRSQSVVSAVEKYGRNVAVVCLSAGVFLAVWNQQEVLLSSLSLSAGYLALLFPLYLVYFLFGKLVSRGESHDREIALVTESGINNNGLAIALAALHLPHALPFMVLSEVPWSCGYWLTTKLVKERPSQAVENQANIQT